MKWRDMNEHERIDRVGGIVIGGGCGVLIFAVLFQFVRALMNA